MIYALTKNGIVERLIILERTNKRELELFSEYLVISVYPYAVMIGDRKTKTGWLRNAGGEAMILPQLSHQEYIKYANFVDELVSAQHKIDKIIDTTTTEILDILEGE